MIEGFWHSERCESTSGGNWSKRKFQIYSGDELWVGQWDYYDDPRCSQHLYGVIRLGNYVQRTERQRDVEDVNHHVFTNYFGNVTAKFIFKRSAINRIIRNEEKLNQSSFEKARRQKRTVSRVYQFLYDTQSSVLQSRWMAMLRGQQTHNEHTTKKPFSTWKPLFGTTELDLHVAKNIPIDKKIPKEMPNRCTDWFNSPLIASSSKHCARYIVETPSIMELRAKLRIDWNGQYILLLGSRNDTRWDAPLRRCGQFSTDNPFLRSYFRRNFFQLFSSASTSRVSAWFLWSQILLCCVYYFVR